MKKTIERIARQSLVTLAVTFLATNVVAGEYDYEAGLSYGNSGTDVSSSLAFVGGNPGSQFGSATTSSDSDRVELSGTWYYSGLSDESGPKSRAAFLIQASGVRLAYSYDDLSGSYASSGLQPPLPPGLLPIPPSTGSIDGTTHALEVGLRHVWEASGWYGLAGATRIDFEFDAVFDGIGSSNDTDETVYTLGIGKYLGQATALDLSIISSEIDGYDITAYGFSFNHVGLVGGNWHYAADLGVAVSDEDGDDGTYSLGLSLFPTTEVEFGIQIVHYESAFNLDSDSYGGFARWFVRDRIELHTSYQRNDNWESDLVSDIDSDQFTVGVNVRF